MKKKKGKKSQAKKNNKLVDIELATTYIAYLFTHKYAGFKRNKRGGGKIVRKHLIG